MGFKNKLDDTHYVLSYPHEQRKKHITVGEMGELLTNYDGTFVYVRRGGSAGVYESSYPRAKCQYCGQWGNERSACGHCGAPIDVARTIVNHNFEGSLYGYPLSECIEVTSMSSAHKEFLLPNGVVVKVPRLLFGGLR